MTDQSSTNYWIIVGSPENFAKTRELGFTIQGIKSRHRKKAEAMRPGDKIVYYVTGAKAFAGISTIASPYFESHEPIWKSKDPKKAEDYPFRVEIEPEIILDDEEWLPAEALARKMEYARKWPADNWTLAFQGNVHKIPAGDFELLRTAISARSAKVGAGV